MESAYISRVRPVPDSIYLGYEQAKHIYFSVGK